jgi:anaerobic selenocysteine-containing dehydrogenase
MTQDSRYTEEIFIENGKLTRRTFIKGVGLITVVGALGSSPSGCAPRKEEHIEEPPDEQVKTRHALCSVNCSCECHLVATIKDGRITSVEPGSFPGRPDFDNACLRGMSYTAKLQDPTARIPYPMKRIGERGEGVFEQISWDEAMDMIAERLEETKTKFGSQSACFYSFTGNLAKLTWEAPTRFAATYGGTSFDIEGIMGDHGASMGMTLVYGQPRGGHDTRDYMNSNMVVLWGRNVADTHVNQFRYLLNAKENGAKIVVVDPRMSSSAAIADLWIPIRPQTDPALALGMMNVIIANDLHDKEWLISHSCAPYLVRDDDGHYLRDGADFVVWDNALGAAVTVTAPGDPDDNEPVPAGDTPATAALTGSYVVNNIVCKPAFEHLLAEVGTYSLARTSSITGLPEDVIENFALEYARAKPAGIRMGQGMQRVWNSHTPFRTVATLGAICGYVGKNGGGVSHSGGTDNVRSDSTVTVPMFNFANWQDTGPSDPILLKSSIIYEMAEKADPYPLDFFWIANSNFVNMSPDANRIINSVFPKISTIVCVDPFWTWTTKYADFVLPGQTYWEKWDMYDHSPWICFDSPAVSPVPESRSDVEIMSMLAQRVGLAKYWDKTDEQWLREFTDSQHPVFDGFEFDTAISEGLWTLNGAVFEPKIPFENLQFKTMTGTFEFYTEALTTFDQQVPTYLPAHDDPAGELGQKYPLVMIQYHDRMNVHSQHILAEPLKVVQSEPQLWINPVDAGSRGIAHGDVVEIFNDRGSVTMRAFLTEGIVPGTTATASGWSPDASISGSHQTLTYLDLNPVEEHISQTSSAFYDILVEVKKA